MVEGRVGRGEQNGRRGIFFWPNHHLILSIGLVPRCIFYPLSIVSLATCLPDAPLLVSLTEITSKLCHSSFKPDPN